MLDIVRTPFARKVAASPERVGAGLTVLRALPSEDLEAIGPFVFLDHMGPAVPPVGGVPAHPHAGIEVVTYMLHGSGEHRDSMGNHSAIEAGGAQWITSGSGMLHAEFPRGGADGLNHGVQLWARQPEALDEAEPKYRAVEPGEIPTVALERGKLRLVAGAYPGFHAAGPVALASPALLMHLTLAPGGVYDAFRPEDFELGAYALAGAADIDGAALAKGEIALLTPAERTSIANPYARPLELLLLGGEPAKRPLVFRGPFVFGDSKRIARAYEDYARGRMGRLDGAPF